MHTSLNDTGRAAVVLPGPGDDLSRIKTPTSAAEDLPKSILEELNQRQLAVLELAVSTGSVTNRQMSLKQTNPTRPISACPPNHRPEAIGRNRQMKISNCQITMIRGTAHPVEFNGIGARVRNTEKVFEKGDSSRVWRDRFRASGTGRMKAGTFINNFIPGEDIEHKGTGIRDIIRHCRDADNALRNILKQLRIGA